MARIARFWFIAMVAAVAVVGGMLIAPVEEAVAVDPGDRVAPALESRRPEAPAPKAPTGEFLVPESSTAAEEAPVEDPAKPAVGPVNRQV